MKEYVDNSFPVLYKKTSKGSLQFWAISVIDNPDHSQWWDIHTMYGQDGTDSPQFTRDVIMKGKNVGKKNETSIHDQAMAEAKAKWLKQKKKGYVESKEAAMAGELDELIEGGINPMLAHSYDDHADKISYPAFGQPKLDGIRCIAIVKEGKATLWTRNRKPILGVPHIVTELEKRYPNTSITLDGELYNHALKEDFEEIASKVRKQTPEPGHEAVEYHVYDLPDDGRQFSDRNARLLLIRSAGSIRRVQTVRINSEAQLKDLYQSFMTQGYEGLMVRNSHGMYVNDRSHNLLKMKEFITEEFEIVGAEEGRAKLKGHVGAFVCRMYDGREFRVKMGGDQGRLKEYFDNPSLYMGKLLTVKYQSLTGANGLPRFPVGVTIRDYE